MTDRAMVAVADAKRLLEQRRLLAGELMMVKGRLPPVCEKYLANKDWRGFFDEASRLTEGFLREMDNGMREPCAVDWNDFRVANAGFLLNVELSKNQRPTTAHEAVWLIGQLIGHVYNLCKMNNDDLETFDEKCRAVNVTRLRDVLAKLPNAMTYYDSLAAESARWQRWLIEAAEKQTPKPVEPQAARPTVGNDAGGGRDEADGKPARALQRCQKLAYYASRYAEWKLERKLSAQEVYDYWKEYGFDLADNDTANAAELAEYKLPDTFATFETQLSNGRAAFDDRRYESRKERKGRSIVDKDEL